MLTTPRLIGERLRPDHLADLRRLHRDPQVMATLSADGRPWPEELSRRSLERGLARWEAHGFGTWMAYRHDNRVFVGYGGLWPTDTGGAPTVELAYAIVSGAWGQGYASELALALVDLAFSRLGLAELVSCTLHHNHASRRVMEKAGFVYEREIIHAGLPHVFYRLRRAAG